MPPAYSAIFSLKLFSRVPCRGSSNSGEEEDEGRKGGGEGQIREGLEGKIILDSEGIGDSRSENWRRRAQQQRTEREEKTT